MDQGYIRLKREIERNRASSSTITDAICRDMADLRKELADLKKVGDPDTPAPKPQKQATIPARPALMQAQNVGTDPQGG